MNAKITLGLILAGFAAPLASGQIVNSAHDFSSMAWSDGEICKPCHTPHFAMEGILRLWNHELTVANYTLHAGAGTAVDDFDIRSRLCLSCHDGTVALDSFGGQSGSSFISGQANLGTDLTNDHPVGSDAQYPPDPAPVWWSHAFRPAEDLQVRLYDWEDQAGVTRKVISCVTCHDEHNAGNIDGMLKISNNASALCLDCHLK
tara:strand:- start:897 stop:1505 length:609 start_codon:yes stop_codon:yes gene_type:complete